MGWVELYTPKRYVDALLCSTCNVTLEVVFINMVKFI